MIEAKTLTEIKLGNGDITHRLLLESKECPKDGALAKLIKFRMLEQLVNNPALTLCGSLEFETLTFKYTNNRWVMELKATEVVPET